MADNVTGLFPRGSTYNGPNKTLSSSYGVSVGLEGQMKHFKDVDSTSGSPGIKSQRSDRVVTCICVRNVSGFTVLPKRLVAWATGFVGRRINGYTEATSEQAAGVTDEFLSSSGARDEDLLWIQVKGPGLLNMPVGQVVDVSEGDALHCLTAATTNCTTAGRARPLIATSSVTDVKAQLINRVGRALSAVSSSQTTGDVLVDLDILK